ncbi:sensor histidine kinase [Algoriphagus sp. H41]|uniref:Oxygen sensor histidine kinase NreB n=2 Tax=Algoriphagus oliviformis TaxID=2811231 RepID=A0ABS3BYU5_9BACT|nr:sensor histidine kinase [Algoriphagus oliviformis]
MIPPDNQIYIIIFSTIFLGGLMSTFVVAMVFIHRQRQAQSRQKMDQMQVEFEKTLRHVENEIHQETLTQIGRDLHDNIGQLLSLTKLNLNSSKPEKHLEARECVNEAIKEVRALSKTLNLDWVESLSLDEYIAQQLQRIQATGFCETSLQSDRSFAELKKEEKLVLIRVVQECLNNAIKHAQPDRIAIRISKNGRARHIEIEDNGQGFDTSKQSNGSGMYNLSKRMETIGGKFSLSSAVGKGTLVNLELPFSV